MSRSMLRSRGCVKINVEVEGRCQDQCCGRGAMSRTMLRSRGGVNINVEVEGWCQDQC